MSIDHFAHKSKTWDMNSRRVKNAQSIATLIKAKVPLQPAMRIMDFGAGTGLLSYFIAPEVESIVAVDSSPSMVEVFQEKSPSFACRTEVLLGDLMALDMDAESFDGIVSSMTLHHIKDIDLLFQKFYLLLRQGGFIALADLVQEDGTFHRDPQGVYHFGFDPEWLCEMAQKVGFERVEWQLASTIDKPHRSFDTFLLTAIK